MKNYFKIFLFLCVYKTLCSVQSSELTLESLPNHIIAQVIEYIPMEECYKQDLHAVDKKISYISVQYYEQEINKSKLKDRIYESYLLSSDKEDFLIYDRLLKRDYYGKYVKNREIGFFVKLWAIYFSQKKESTHEGKVPHFRKNSEKLYERYLNQLLLMSPSIKWFKIYSFPDLKILKKRTYNLTPK